MDLEVIRSYMPLYTEAFILTIKIGWIGIALSLVIGVLTAFAMHFRVPVLAKIAKVNRHEPFYKVTPESLASLATTKCNFE